MNKKIVLTLSISMTIPMLMTAQNNPENTPAENELSAECIKNASLVHESVKNKMYAEAYEPWMQVYTNCPGANKSIYTNGAKIIDWLWQQAGNDETKKTDIRKLVMEMYDKRIQYFGNDKKYPTPYILGEKGLEYCEHFDNDTLKEPAYQWLKQSVQGLGVASKISVMVKFFELSYGLYKADPTKYGEQFIADYTLVSGYMQAIANDNSNKNASQGTAQKEYFDNVFAASGVASCEKLDEIYAEFVEKNSQYLEDLLKLMNLYKRVNCTETPVYFAAAETAHKLQPSAESAAGCAKMCMKKEDWNGALEYYNEAIGLLDENDTTSDREDYLYAMAYINMDKKKDYLQARTYARASLESNPKQGRCYILIGLCYATAKPYNASNVGAAKAAVLNKTVFWAAVDQFIKAKTIDESCTEDANKLIATYSHYFPTKEEIFDLPNELGGGTFVVGGWINENTVCRAAR